MGTQNPLPFFVLQQFFLQIARDWEERPLTVEEANTLSSRIVGPIEEIIDALEVGASKEQQFDLLTKLISD
jgi:3-deoxy-D-arabino-heptulosonate 7-phosphate (DAHP) synthase